MSDTPPTSHPRYLSLMTRNKIVSGVERGVTSMHGLIAHGRGEAFDYLLGEQTHPFALKAIRAAAQLLREARHPVLSVNGNVCALAAEEMVTVAKACGALLEVNIFHTSDARERAISSALREAGAADVLMPSRSHALEHLDHNRRWVNPEGIWKADVVFVPLEDGDRCEALTKNGKRVITVDLNPLSRTSRTATITIVDNLIRCLPLLTQEITSPSRGDSKATYSNSEILREAEHVIRGQ